MLDAQRSGRQAVLLEEAPFAVGHELYQVAQIRPFAAGAPESAEVQLTARLIGRLYDAVDWPDAPADLLERVRATAGIPIYDGLAAAGHPTAQLAALLGTESSMADRRRFILQAVLLVTII